MKIDGIEKPFLEQTASLFPNRHLKKSISKKRVLIEKKKELEENRHYHCR